MTIILQSFPLIQFYVNERNNFISIFNPLIFDGIKFISFFLKIGKFLINLRKFSNQMIIIKIIDLFRKWELKMNFIHQIINFFNNYKNLQQSLFISYVFHLPLLIISSKYIFMGTQCNNCSNLNHQSVKQILNESDSAAYHQNLDKTKIQIIDIKERRFQKMKTSYIHSKRKKQIRRSGGLQSSNQPIIIKFIQSQQEVDFQIEDSDSSFQTRQSSFNQKLQLQSFDFSQKQKKITFQLSNQTSFNFTQKILITKDNFVILKHENIYNYYKLIKKLGEGTYGTVYKARCYKTQQTRAIKMIKKQENIDQQCFFAQLEILKQLDHPNIVRLYQIFEHEQYFYIVTEYCQGGQLMYELKRNQFMSEEIVAHIFHQIIGGVQYMHQKNIVHRDLKLENILYDKKRKKCDSKMKNQILIKIIDFGTSKLFKKNNMLQSVVGSPYYVAPEVLQGNYNKKCDIWSCGIILYILLCGVPPFKGQTKQQIFFNILHQKNLFQQKQWKSISTQAKYIVKSMLQRNVSKRFSARRILQSAWLQKNLSAEPISPDLLINLQRFYFKNKFNAVILTYIASNTVSKDSRNELANKFNQIDKDRNGYIDMKQLSEAYLLIHGKIQKQNIEKIIETLDVNNDGKIEFTQFIVGVYSHKMLNKSSLVKAFDFFDKDNSGFLEENQIKNLLQTQDNEEVKEVIQKFGSSQNGTISKLNFLNCFRDQFVNIQQKA